MVNGEKIINDRISYIDGLRGFAILEVIFFHSFSRWGNVEPYTQEPFLVNLFINGWLGVQLFFAVSGYVIYMTVLRCENFFMFAISRYLRLAPAMLVAALLLYSTSFFIPERPLGPPDLIDFLPSITFIDPGLLSKLTGLEVRSLDGAFWSLYVEVKFYAIVAIAYFILKDKNLTFLVTLYTMWCCLTLAQVFEIESNLLITLLKALNYAGVEFYGWFLLGIFAYKYKCKVSTLNSSMLLVVTAAAIGTTKLGDVAVTIGAGITALLFLLPLVLMPVRILLTNRLFLFLGYVSYPLYLIHQNLVTGLAIKLHTICPALPPFLYPLPFLLSVIAISYLIAKIEPTLKQKIECLVPPTVLGYRLLKVRSDKRP